MPVYHVEEKWAPHRLIFTLYDIRDFDFDAVSKPLLESSMVQDVYRSILLDAEEERGRALLAGLVQLAHSMGIRALSEGVETKEQLDIALAAGCDFIQGFYFSRVLPKREAERYLRELTEQ